MYRPAPYVVDDLPRLHGVIAGYPFATIAWIDGGTVLLAYAPVVCDPDAGPLGGVRFHLARANPVARAADARLYLSFRGPDAYVSPDWYRSAGMVPTWNYVAVEGRGPARRLDDRELGMLLTDLSALEEQRLLPKKPWTLDKVPGERLAALAKAIVGFSVAFDSLEGKFKLSQDKRAEDFDGVLAGLDGKGDADALAVAKAMRGVRAAG